MSIRSDPLDELAIPDGTTVEEHDLVTDGDVIVGGQSTVEFGLRGDDVLAGERVSFGGHIEAEGDCRLDMWSDVAEDVLVGGDAYLGERVHVGGELKIAGDVDIGDDVDIDESFEASGHIVIRNPVPTVVFLVIYLSQLLRIGEEEAAEQLADQLVDADDGDDQPVVIPRGARVSDDAWRVSTPATVGDDCRLHGNIRAESLSVGADTTVFGSLRAKGDIAVGEGTEIKGDVTTRAGDVRIARGAVVWGDISAEDVELHEHAIVEGTVRVSGELTQVRDALGPDPAEGGSVEDETDGDDPESDAEPGEADEDEASESDEPADDAEPSDAADEGADGDDEGPEEVATPDVTPSEAAAVERYESREELEADLDGVVPMVGSEPEPDPDPDPEPRENGHDDDSELAEVE